MNGGLSVKEQADGCIEGTYKDYIVLEPFQVEYLFSRFNKSCCIRARNITNWNVARVPTKRPILAEISDQLGKEDYHRLVQY